MPHRGGATNFSPRAVKGYLTTPGFYPPAASTAAIAVMLTMPRAVTEGVRTWAGFAGPMRIGPTGSASEIMRVSCNAVVARVEIGEDQHVGRSPSIRAVRLIDALTRASVERAPRPPASRHPLPAPARAIQESAPALRASCSAEGVSAEPKSECEISAIFGVDAEPPHMMSAGNRRRRRFPRRSGRSAHGCRRGSRRRSKRSPATTLKNPSLARRQPDDVADVLQARGEAAFEPRQISASTSPRCSASAPITRGR